MFGHNAPMFINSISKDGHALDCVAKHVSTEYVKPEWVRPSQATKVFGIGRTKLYELIAEGKIKSVSLKKRGTARGTRLISYDSLVDFVESHVDGGEVVS